MHGNKGHDEFFEQFYAAIRRRCPIVFKDDHQAEDEHILAQLEAEMPEAPERARWGND